MASTELGRMSPVEILDPTLLLSTDLTENDAYGERSRTEESWLPDIQMPPHAALLLGSPDESELLTPPVVPGFAETSRRDDSLPVTSKPALPLPIAAEGSTVEKAEGPKSEQLKHHLWKSRISPLSQPSADSPAVSLSNRKMDDLKKVIEQIRSIEVEPPRGELAEPQQPAQQPSDTSPAITPEPNTIPPAKPPVVSIVEPETQPSPAPGQSPTPDRQISDRTVQMIDEMLKDANHITNPLELADVLFRGGRPSTAGLYYKQALATIAADDPNMADERAWILFQIGNCLKYDDPNTARGSYAELIRTYPDSPWAEAAKAGHNLIDWEQQDQPRKLIQDLNSSRRSAPQPGK